MAAKVTFEEIVNVLPADFARSLENLFERYMLQIEEVRMRCGFLPTVLVSDSELPFGNRGVSGNDLREVLERATRSSVHTALEQVKNGYVVLKGGHRIGLCGTVSRKDGATVSLRHLSSVSIRFARAVEGQANDLFAKLVDGDGFHNTLILGPPGSGKTTLLRDLIRVLSDKYGYRVGVADERGEIAAMWQGQPQLYVGKYTDILDGAPKAEGMSILLRGMNPQVLAADEITQKEDVAAMIEAAGCGASLLVTAHGSSAADLSRRSVYRAMLSERVFQRMVIVERGGGKRKYRVEVLE